MKCAIGFSLYTTPWTACWMHRFLSYDNDVVMWAGCTYSVPGWSKIAVLVGVKGHYLFAQQWLLEVK